jgi:hypothetical protein
VESVLEAGLGPPAADPVHRYGIGPKTACPVSRILRGYQSSGRKKGRASHNARINSLRSCSTFSVFPCFHSLKAEKNRNDCAPRKGRSTMTAGLKSRPLLNIWKTRTASDHFCQFFRSDQFSSTARCCTNGRICVVMYSCQMGLSE